MFSIDEAGSKDSERDLGGAPNSLARMDKEERIRNLAQQLKPKKGRTAWNMGGDVADCSICYSSFLWFTLRVWLQL